MQIFVHSFPSSKCRYSDDESYLPNKPDGFYSNLFQHTHYLGWADDFYAKIGPATYSFTNNSPFLMYVHVLPCHKFIIIRAKFDDKYLNTNLLT